MLMFMPSERLLPSAEVISISLQHSVFGGYYL